jgi:HlyD family secretion protein
VQIGAVESLLTVSRIYPQVKDGTFIVDFFFVHPPPPGLLPGQTLQGKIVLGDAVQALVLPGGPYLEDTGGDWVFVLEPDGASAHRRRIKVGRRSLEQVEVLSGLRAGEQVIISDYRAYARIDRIDLDQ